MGRSGRTRATNEATRVDQRRRTDSPRVAVQHGRAVRTVAGYAIDADDCARLLAMLGLNPTDGKRDH